MAWPACYAHTLILTLTLTRTLTLTCTLILALTLTLALTLALTLPAGMPYPHPHPADNYIAHAGTQDSDTDSYCDPRLTATVTAHRDRTG